MDDIVTIFVRNKKFEVPKNVLFKAELFKNMFEDTEVTGPIILNESPEIFKHFIEVLYDNEYPYNIIYKKWLDKYLVNLEYIDSITFYDPLKDIKLEIDKLNSKIQDMTYKCKVCGINDAYYDHIRQEIECNDCRQCRYWPHYVQCTKLCEYGNYHCDEHLYKQY